MKKKRVFSAEQKMDILHEAEQNGMLSTCRKYEIAQSLYYHWKSQYDIKGIDGLTDQYYGVGRRVRELGRKMIG